MLQLAKGALLRKASEDTATLRAQGKVGGRISKEQVERALAEQQRSPLLEGDGRAAGAPQG